MNRDIAKICSGIQDVLVVGGGIHGAAIAYHAAQAGYRTVIVDKNDFCSATSANSLKILHGGLRYLQHGNIRRMRHSILSRREMMLLAPHLVEPLPCMMPIYGKGLRGRMALQAALLVNDLVSWDRNRGLPEDIRLPRGHVVSVEKCLGAVPGLARKELRGAAVWYDVLALDTERLVLEYILHSVRCGAGAANYAEVTTIAKEPAGTYYVSVEDKLTGRPFQVRTRFIVNASGPWFEKRFSAAPEGDNSQKQQWALAMNVVSRKKIFENYAVALEGHTSYQDKDALIKRNKRLYFFVPWRGGTMIGTEYEVSRAEPDTLQVNRETVQNMVNEINAIYPAARLRYEDISFYHAGLLPMRSASGDSVQLEKNSTFAPCRGEGMERVLCLKSVKYTTAPHIAHQVIAYLRDRVQPALQENPKGFCVGIGEWNSIDPEMQGLLQQRYGPRGSAITKYLGSSDKNEPLVIPGAKLLKAEVKYLVKEEMACTLSDVIFRRTGLGTAECPAKEILQAIAACMGDILGWDGQQQQRQVQEVLQRYLPLSAAAS